jgi:hypothetical protein
MNRFVFAITLAALVGPERAARAHAPKRLDPNLPTVIEDATVSYALFGIFETGDEVFTVKLEHAERFAAPVEIFVPRRDELRTHRPMYAVVGVGLPEPTSEERALLPADLPAGWGAVVERHDVRPRPVFFESFMRRFYWSSGNLAVVFPAGASEIWMWSPDRTTGKFGLGFGIEEGGEGYFEVFNDWAFYAY